MTSTTVRKTATATVATALLGLGSFLAPAAAHAQIIDPGAPIEPSDVFKIDSPELTVDVRGDDAHLTATAPDNMACIGPLVYEGAISASDIDPEDWDQSFFDELLDEPAWPTEAADLRVVVNESSDLAGMPGAAVSPHEVTVPGLNDGDYVATTMCVSEDYVDVPMTARQLGEPGQLSAFQDTQFPLEFHFRNISIGTTGSVNLGSVDVFGSLGSVGS